MLIAWVSPLMGRAYRAPRVTFAEIERDRR